MLNSKQRAMLRSMANEIQPIFQIGKEGIGENMIEQLSDALEARELIKISILQNCDLEPREACGQLCEALEAEPVQCIGRKIVLFRPSIKNPVIRL